ncbi:hypothetical protein Y710_03980 [Gordonia sp. QH-12]|uniref:FtsK/SpoIIIE domain-containing protein n=1 Tax=Gordonia sp. QH-12 TaxID=1437876 RepID=UPI0007836576|nr:FtsK/SpoIIIE domain-containing protein [Gordonia sp. QH-12]KXT58243.1 hypothetical protein Y710_03980 [Gordonia sp. QH-12]
MMGATAMISADSIVVNVGVDEFGAPINLDLLTGGHVLICGETRSGKSVATYVLLGALAGRPDVRVVGVDPTSLLLSPFLDRHPHERLIELGTSDPDRMVGVLTDVVAEMDRRLGLLRERGWDKFSRVCPAEPLLVVVLEELPGSIRTLAGVDKARASKPAERLEPKFKLLFERIVSEAAKCGIVVCSLAQRPDADVLGGYARSQHPTRLGFRVSNSEELRMMFPSLDQDEAKRAMSLEPGCGYVRIPGPEGHRAFRAHFVPSYTQYVERVRAFPIKRLAGMVSGDELR